MEEAVDARYWCHMCSRLVSPDMDMELKCPICDSGFVEEMDARGGDGHPVDDLRSDRAFSLWAPIFLGMMGGRPSRRRRPLFPRVQVEEQGRGDSDAERSDFDGLLMRRRSRDPASMLQLLESLREGISFGSDNPETARDGDIIERDGDRDGESLLLINPFSRVLLFEGSFSDSNQPPHEQNLTAASFGDYFIGQGLDLLLQHLADNDPNRYGTPPAQKEAIEAMPNVKINEALQCSVCLDDFEIGSEGKEMPCKHKFHSQCILPWLELHSSCPVCRFQIPSLDANEQNGNRSPSANIRVVNNINNSDEGGSGGHGENERDSGSGRRFSWPFNGLFSLSGSSQSGGTSSSGPSPSASGGN